MVRVARRDAVGATRRLAAIELLSFLRGYLLRALHGVMEWLGR